MKIVQKKISDLHDNCIWYDGLIAEHKGQKLYATGDIKIIYSKNGVEGSWSNGKTYGDFPIEIENDDDISKMFDDKQMYEKEGYEWVYNNWFEIVDENNDSVWADCVLDTYSYDDAIEMLKEEDK